MVGLADEVTFVFVNFPSAETGKRRIEADANA